MTAFILRRVADTLPILFLLSLLVFVLFKLIPGDYLSEMEMDPTVTRESVEALRQQYGLDRSVLIQYAFWAKGVVTGNFGYSFAQRRAAADLILERLGGTFALALATLLLTLLLSLPLGLISAVRAGTWIDRTGLILSLACLSFPTLLSALLFLYLASVTRLLPVGGSDGLLYLILPSLTLALPTTGFFVRAIRAELIERLNQPFVLSAAARGLPLRRVLWHALRDALNPLISFTGVTLGGLLSGAVVVEKVFGWPGIGSLAVDSILSRDLYVALNTVMVSAVLVVAANLCADILLALNDPEIRLR